MRRPFSDQPGSSDRNRAADDRARPPGELLDNLRLRLSQLAANHPSAPGDGRAGRPAWGPPEGQDPGGREPADGADGTGDENAAPGGAAGQDGRSGSGGGSGLGEAFGGLHSAKDFGAEDFGAEDFGAEDFGPDQAGMDADGGAGTGGGGAAGGSGRAGDAARSAGRAIARGLGALGSMEVPGRDGRGDPYRPWFMTGEPGSPWWASGPF